MHVISSLLLLILSIHFPGQRGLKGAKMAGYLAAEHLNSDGEPEVPKKSRSTGMRRPRRKVAKKARLEVEAEESEGGSRDCDFVSISSDSQSSASGSEDDELPVLTNAEVCKSCSLHLLRRLIPFYPACRHSSFQDSP